MNEAVEAVPVIVVVGGAYARYRRRLRWRLKVEYDARGALLYAKRGGRKLMVSRVSFDRSPGKCKYPDVEFDQQLAEALARTRSRCSVMNATERSQRE